MDLYVLRHAEAGEAARDEDRELTPHGRHQAQAVAAGIAWLKPNIGAVLTSPLSRARQTAAPVAKALGVTSSEVWELAAGREPAEALALLPRHERGILLVGHEPQLSAIAHAATGGRIRLRKAMLFYIQLHSIEPAYGDLCWLLSWRQIERLGRAQG